MHTNVGAAPAAEGTGARGVLGPSAPGVVVAGGAGRRQDPDCGEGRPAGWPVRNPDPAALRRAVGYAFDRPVLIGATV
ncbi:ABC transporter ATP-binding protein, partial [Micromonospora arborensis]